MIDKLITNAINAEQELDKIESAQFEKLEQLEQIAQNQGDRIEQFAAEREIIRQQAEALLKQMEQTDKSLAEAKMSKFTLKEKEQPSIEDRAIDQLLQLDFLTEEERSRLEQLKEELQIGNLRMKELFEETDRLIAKAKKTIRRSRKNRIKPL